MAASTVHEIVDERRWLQLGLGGGDEALEDSDEENENDPNVVRTLHYHGIIDSPRPNLTIPCRVRSAAGRTSSRPSSLRWSASASPRRSI